MTLVLAVAVLWAALIATPIWFLTRPHPDHYADPRLADLGHPPTPLPPAADTYLADEEFAQWEWELRHTP